MVQTNPDLICCTPFEYPTAELLRLAEDVLNTIPPFQWIKRHGKSYWRLDTAEALLERIGELGLYLMVLRLRLEPEAEFLAERMKAKGTEQIEETMYLFHQKLDKAMTI